MRTIVTAIAVVTVVTAAAIEAASFELRYIGQNIVPSGTQALGTTVGGLSGIDYAAARGTYAVLSDARSALNPARYCTVALDLTRFNRTLTPGRAGVSFDAVTTLARPDGTPFPRNGVDPEALCVRGGQLYWDSEGERLAGDLQDPFVREMHADGSHVCRAR
ncbi:MAG: esterase-like activity of phytase family protein [Gammaproteobacteria bacterium]